ncbi:MAG TPA: hypothetical protein VFW07_01050 [Parafilimonas sp.]|nr:hypothetical protein [Parafilimonas sp.]
MLTTADVKARQLGKIIRAAEMIMFTPSPGYDVILRWATVTQYSNCGLCEQHDLHLNVDSGTWF